MEKKKEPVQKAKDWSVNELYGRAWNIAWKNKILWIFAMAVYGLSSGGSNNLGNHASSAGKSGQNNETLNVVFHNSIASAHEIGNVLGASTSAFLEHVIRIFSFVPIPVYIALCIELIFIILLAVITGYIYQSWATGALFNSIETCIDEKKASISQASENAFSHLPALLKLQIIPIISVSLIGIVYSLFLFGAFPLGIRLLLALLCVVVFGILSLVYIWAPRKVMTENKPAWVSLQESYRMVKKKLWPMVFLGFLNLLITFSGIVVVIIALVLLVFLSGFVSIFLGQGFFMVSMIPIIILFIATIMVLGSFWDAVKATVWSLALRKIRGKYENS